MASSHSSVSHLLLPSPPNEIGPQKNISKYIQDISKIFKINTKYQAAAGPARPGPSPGPRGPGPPGRAGARLVFGISWCIWIYLNICWYMFGIFFVYCLYIFGIFFGIFLVYVLVYFWYTFGIFLVSSSVIVKVQAKQK